MVVITLLCQWFKAMYLSQLIISIYNSAKDSLRTRSGIEYIN